jgi:hypothetical protein
MRKLLFVHFLFLVGSSLFAQNKIRFIVQQKGDFEDKIYIAGSFNDWNPGDDNYLLSPLDGKTFYPGYYREYCDRGVDG